MDLPLIDMRGIYKQGNTVKLLKDVKTKTNKFSKNEEFIVEDVTETTLYLINEKGGLTIHRFISDLIEKV